MAVRPDTTYSVESQEQQGTWLNTADRFDVAVVWGLVYSICWRTIETYSVTWQKTNIEAYSIKKKKTTRTEDLGKQGWADHNRER